MSKISIKANMFSIGDLAKQADCNVQTVRYYEQIGLLSKPQRSEGRQRRYGVEDLRQLGFICHGRELGFSTDEIKELLAMERQATTSCKGIDELAQSHLDSVQSRIKALKNLERELKRMIDKCPHGKVEDCNILDTLKKTDHSYCLSDHRSDAPHEKGIKGRKSYVA